MTTYRFRSALATHFSARIPSVMGMATIVTASTKLRASVANAIANVCADSAPISVPLLSRGAGLSFSGASVRGASFSGVPDR